MRRHRSTILATAAICLLAAAAPGGACAQTDSEAFSLTDYNKDGVIDRQEYQRRMIEVFYFDDKNKDGFVTVEELQAIGPVDMQAFRAADKNGDGKLSVDELVTYRVVDFEDADKNHEGVLSYEEVEAWRASHASR